MTDSVLHEFMPPNHLLPKRVSVPESEYDFPDFDIPQLNQNNGTQQPIQQWEAQDILRWIIQVAEKFEVDYSEFGGENYANLKGADLLRMSEMDFEAKSPGFGKFLHGSLLMENLKSGSSSSAVNRDYHEVDGRSYLDLDGVIKNPCNHGSESDSENSRPPCPESPRARIEDRPPVDPPKKKRGRPRDPNKKGKKKPPSFGRLWEFLRELLKKPESCPSLIKWEDHEKGEFRFVQSDKVAKIWGTRKGNREMTYEKLSRAMRYYYKPEVLKDNPKRNVYQFGNKAYGWKVSDPNFEERNSSLRKGVQASTKPNPVLAWQPSDILNWLIEEALKLEVDYSEFRGENYANLTGKQLAEMSEAQFEVKSPGFGSYLYCCLFSKMYVLNFDD